MKHDSPLPARDGKSIFDGAPSFSLRNRMTRAVWMLCWGLLASWTPPPLHRWRTFLLRAFGARIGSGCKVYGSARIWYPPNLIMEANAIMGPRVDCYNQGPVTIGRYAVVSQGAYLCTGTHDISSPDFQLQTRPLFIGENAWICADAFVGPGVTVGNGTVLGARGAAFRDLEPWTVQGGNPARKLKDRPRFTRNG